MQNKISLTLLTVGLCLAGLSCKQNPVDRLLNPVPSGAVNGVGANYIVYNDELNTGGGLGFFPGGESQSIDLHDNTPPARSLSDIRYTWTGQNVSSNFGPEHTFAGFSLLVTPDFSTLATAQPKDLSRANYGHLQFSIRGSLSDRTYVKIDGPSNGVTASTDSVRSRRQGDSSGGDTDANGKEIVITNDWQDYSIHISPQYFSSVKIFCQFSFAFDQPIGTTEPGAGGTIYVDNIQYVP